MPRWWDDHAEIKIQLVGYEVPVSCVADGLRDVGGVRGMSSYCTTVMNLGCLGCHWGLIGMPLVVVVVAMIWVGPHDDG